MHRHEQDVFLRSETNQLRPQQWPYTQIERNLCLLRHSALHFSVPFIFVQRLQIVYGKVQARGLCNHLERLALSRLEARSQRLMSPHNLL
jgi:hypothetical protein